MLDFRAWIAASDYGVIAVTETWLDPVRDFAGEFHLPGYTMFHRDRVGRAGGGVMLYVQTHLAPIELRTDSAHEFVGAELRGCDPPVTVIVVYRPPHRPLDYDESLYRDLSASISDVATVVVGDFNCPIDWSLVNVGAEGMRLVDFANDNFLSQMVTVPTRGRNILDLVFVSDEDMVRDVEVGLGLAGSDHGVVSFEVVVTAGPDTSRPVRRWHGRIQHLSLRLSCIGSADL